MLPDNYMLVLIVIFLGHLTCNGSHLTVGGFDLFSPSLVPHTPLTFWHQEIQTSVSMSPKSQPLQANFFPSTNQPVLVWAYSIVSRGRPISFDRWSMRAGVGDGGVGGWDRSIRGPSLPPDISAVYKYSLFTSAVNKYSLLDWPPGKKT